MAQNAVARQLLHDLRQKIAAIEGTLPERFGEPGAVSPVAMAANHGAPPSLRQPGRMIEPGGEAVLLRQNGMPADIITPASNTRPPQAANRNAPEPHHAPHILQSGMPDFDRALGGGLARAALCEIYGAEARDTGAVSGFALALAGLARRQQEEGSPTANGGQAPILWIGAADLIAETGFPHMPGIAGTFGIPHQALLFARAEKPLDALWIAGEAAGLSALSAIIIEIHGNPSSLDLTATRRLHRRARAAGRPVFLLRLSAEKQPTAAPVRFCVSPAPARPREIFGQPLARSLGASAFSIEIDKCRANPGRRLILEWNSDEHCFCERRSKDPVAVVPASADRQNHAPALWPVLARRSRRGRQTG